MRVIPLQVQFSQPGEENGKAGYGIPNLTTIVPATPCSDGSYIFHTHDKCGSCEPGPFYQVVFRVEDTSPYKKEDIKLSLRSRNSATGSETINNDLYYDKKSDLWYQRSKYKRTQNGNWRLVGENKSDSLNAESVTASGVFRVYAYFKGQQLTGVEYTFPWIYILPSSTSKENYIHMLSDLITLNEKLVRNEGSSTGIGSLTTVEAETEYLNREIEKTEQLEETILCAMKLPSELLEKTYVKTNINKIKRFDARTMREYVKYGLSGQLSGIRYIEDHDTYENRVIKYVLKCIKEHLEYEDSPQILSEEGIKK